MNAKSLWAAGLLLALLISPAAAADSSARIRIAMLSDGGTFMDGSFNQACREGLEILLDRLPIHAHFRETTGAADYARVIAEMAERNYRLIIGVGFGMAQPIEELALRYPLTYFATVDGGSTHPPANVRSLIFRVDECAFPAGYLAAAWADLKDPNNPAVGYVGGMEADSVRQFTVPFANGVKHYNTVKGRNVQVFGQYAGTFNDAERGAQLATEMIEQGADVIFGAGSITGNGAIMAAKNAGKWAIGVDMDQYFILSEASDILLTSCVKRMDRAVTSLVQSVCENEFWGGAAYEGTLANHGVALASYHEFEHQIPDATKAEIHQILQDIVRGALSTGWHKE